MATVLEVYTTEDKPSVVRFVGKRINAKDIHKEIFLVSGWKFWQVKRFVTGSRNSLEDVRKSQIIKRRCGIG
jgi:hypothetical protein